MNTLVEDNNTHTHTHTHTNPPKNGTGLSSEWTLKGEFSLIGVHNRVGYNNHPLRHRPPTEYLGPISKSGASTPPQTQQNTTHQLSQLLLFSLAVRALPIIPIKLAKLHKKTLSQLTFSPHALSCCGRGI